MKQMLAFAAAGLLMVSCGANSVATTSVSEGPPPSGFYLYEGDGFTLFMPSDWTVLDREDVGLENILENLSGTSLEELIPTIETTFARDARLIAFDLEGSTREFTNNLNILRLEPPNLRGDAILGMAEEEFERLGAGNVTGRVEWLWAGETVIVSYSIPDELGGGEGLSYSVLTGDALWVATYTARTVEPFGDSFHMMMDSFHVG